MMCGPRHSATRQDILNAATAAIRERPTHRPILPEFFVLLDQQLPAERGPNGELPVDGAIELIDIVLDLTPHDHGTHPDEDPDRDDT